MQYLNMKNQAGMSRVKLFQAGKIFLEYTLFFIKVMDSNSLLHIKYMS
jgi:hypothetical protein